jgi:hypothetical protein
MESPSINLLAPAYERAKQLRKFNIAFGHMMAERWKDDNDRLLRWMVTGKNERVVRSDVKPVPYRKDAPRRVVAAI